VKGIGQKILSHFEILLFISFPSTRSTYERRMASSSLCGTKKTTQQSNAFIYNGDGIGEKHNDDDVVETMITSSTCGDGGAGMHIDLSLRRTAFEPIVARNNCPYFFCKKHSCFISRPPTPLIFFVNCRRGHDNIHIRHSVPPLSRSHC
jgi:hypothetical protein